MKKSIGIKQIYLIGIAVFIFCFFLLIKPAFCTDFFKAKITITIDLTQKAKGQTARLWLPYAISGPNQRITLVSINGTFSHCAVYTDRVFKRPMLYASWPSAQKIKRLVYSFHVERYSRHETKKLSKGALIPIDTVYFKRFLQGSKLAPINERVKSLSKAIVGQEKNPFKKAWLIYKWVTDNMRRDPTVKGCGCANVCILLDRLSGKCADIHSVFVALLKGAGIPAREVFGLRLSKRSPNEITNWQHCWAEFYVPGYGWFVADPGDYLKAILEKSLDPASQEAKRLQKFYFGNVDPYRLRFGIGRDLELNPKPNSGKLNYFMYPYAEIGGKPIDWLAPENFKYSIIQN